MARFDGKRVLVTGGSSGIGEAVARAFAGEGARVAVVASSDVRKTEPIVADIAAAGGRAHGFAADVSSGAAVSRLVDEVVAWAGGVDVLVNAAGLYYATPVGKTGEDAYQRMADTNLKGAFLMINAVAPLMQAQRSGKIVNVASVAAVLGVKEFSLYCALKAGVAMLTKAMARELAPFDININAIGPGNTATPLNAEYRNDPKHAEYLAGMAAATPSNHTFSETSDIAGGVLFLASPEARAMHGALLLMDEGLSTGL
jgi:NAD(P)-dependent dehydrogenase (short-subunit alcohol dehydrogenase family)